MGGGGFPPFTRGCAELCGTTESIQQIDQTTQHGCCLSQVTSISTPNVRPDSSSKRDTKPCTYRLRDRENQSERKRIQVNKMTFQRIEYEKHRTKQAQQDLKELKKALHPYSPHSPSTAILDTVLDAPVHPASVTPLSCPAPLFKTQLSSLAWTHIVTGIWGLPPVVSGVRQASRHSSPSYSSASCCPCRGSLTSSAA